MLAVEDKRWLRWIGQKINTNFALLVTVLVVAIGVGFFVGWFFADTARVPSKACDDGNVCTVDYKTSVQGYCERFPLSTDATCTSGCYAAGAKLHCDGFGSCIGRAEDCKGYCAVDSDSIWGDGNATLFPLLDYFLVPDPANFIEDAFVFGIDNVQSLDYCYANQYFTGVMQVQLSIDTDLDAFWDIWSGATLNCSQLLNYSSAVADARCIESTQISLDGTFVSDFLATIIDEPIGYTGRVCLFRYACGRHNATVFADPAKYTGGASIGSASTNGTQITDNARKLQHHFAQLQRQGGPGLRRVIEQAMPRMQAAMADVAGQLQKRGAANPLPRTMYFV